MCVGVCACACSLLSCSVMSNSVTPRTVHARLLCPWDSPGSGSPFPSPGIVLTRGLSRHLLHCRQILYPSVIREALNQLYNSKNHNNRELLFLQCLWVSTLPWACGEALSVSWCLVLHLEDGVRLHLRCLPHTSGPQ